jgi:hypothetical protein
MGGCRVPGPQCKVAHPTSDDNDAGTVARTTMPVSAPTGTASTNAATPPTAVPAVQGWPSALEWSQFRVVSAAPDGGKEYAQTATTQAAVPEITVERHGRQFRLGPFTLPVSLNQDDCWVVKDKATAQLLRHEQVHWDIAGLVAHETSRALKSVSAARTQDLGRAVQATMKRMEVKAQGLDATGQKQWEDRVAASIKNQNSSLPNPPAKYNGAPND